MGLAVRFLVLGCLCVLSLPAQTVEGKIIIKRKLTKRSVTAAADSYQRGVSVPVGEESASDALSFERARVVVYLEGSLPSRPITATMDQKDRRFAPDLLVIPAGSTVSFPNLDPIFHNVFSLSKPKSFDLGNYRKDQTRDVVFQQPGIVFVHCHLHANMGGAIVVTPNQWAVKAEPSGQYALRDIPPGKHTVVAWHKAAGFFRQPVEIKPNQRISLDFSIPLEADEPRETISRR